MKFTPFLTAVAALLLGACASGGKKGEDSSYITGRNPDSLASRTSAVPTNGDFSKRSMYDFAGESGDAKEFKTGLFRGKKEFKAQQFKGSKLFKTGQYADGAHRSPWAGMTSRESAQEAPANLRGTYGTGDSRFSGQSARESGTSYGADGNTYKTGGDIIGSRAIGNASSPKIIPNANTQGGMSQSQIQALLKKN